MRLAFIGTLGVCLAGVLGIGLIGSLDKDGVIGLRLPPQVPLLASPFTAIAIAAVLWRRHRWIPMLGFLVALSALGLSLSGSWSDYRTWSRSAPGQEVTSFGAFLALLSSWGFCLGLFITGGICFFLDRSRASSVGNVTTSRN